MSTAQIGLGLAALGRPAYINLGHGEDVADPSVDAMERSAHAVLDAAYAGACAGSTRRARTVAPRRSSRRGSPAAGSAR